MPPATSRSLLSEDPGTVAAGAALLVNPVHRSFYGIAGIILGIASFPASNLGGFFLGMLLAIVGGAH